MTNPIDTCLKIAELMNSKYAISSPPLYSIRRLLSILDPNIKFENRVHFKLRGDLNRDHRQRLSDLLQELESHREIVEDFHALYYLNLTISKLSLEAFH